MILSMFWNIKTDLKNVFVLINENDDVINTVIKRLAEANYLCDLVIIKEIDTIYKPNNDNIVSQSIDAYKIFLNNIKLYFEFV